MNQHPEGLDLVFAPGGTLCDALPDYECRPEQRRMAQAVLERFFQGGCLLVEAGTGTGKSLAYLVPAALWALQNDCPVVISTQTINLQEQLVHKDLPLLARILPQPLPIALVKGWSNYLCYRRLELALRSSLSLPEEIRSGLEYLQGWARRAREGSRSELEFSASRELWAEVEAQPDACPHERCPWIRSCFVFLARRQAQAARILVVNHALLCADLAIKQGLSQEEGAVLPAYSRLVVDEAHHLAEAAGAHLGRQVKWAKVRRVLQGAYRREGGKEGGGLVPLLRNLLAADNPPDPRRQELIHAIDRDLLVPHPALVETQDDFWHRLELWLAGWSEAGAARIRLLNSYLDEEEWEEAGRLGRRAAQALCGYAAALARVVEGVRELPGGNEDLAVVVEECAGLGARMHEMGETLPYLLEAQDPDQVFWVERGAGKPFELGICCAPLDAGAELDRLLLTRLESGVFTSATLSAGEGFAYMSERLGLDRGSSELSTLCLDSSFDYGRQVFLGLPEDLPLPDDPEFLPRAMQSLSRLILGLGGRTFLLFTSYRMLVQAARMLTRELEGSGIEVLTQGDGSRHLLLERFRSGRGAVLLGTDSFWEGVDVPGEALSCVIIMRLPFKVPTEPVMEAMAEALETEGRSAFLNLTLPMAVLKCRQGFGRLIRRKTDRGLVFILDSRILKKSYGRSFVTALKAGTPRRGALEELVGEALEWLEAATPPDQG